MITDNAPRIIQAYNTHYRQRYGVEPLPMDGAERTAMRDLLNNYGVERCLELVEYYFQQDGTKGWFVEKGHDVFTLKKDAPKIWAFAANRKKTKFIVGKTSSGQEVVSSDPNEFRDTAYYVKPIPFIEKIS